MHECPCCSYPLLRHIQHHEIYWFCPHCRAMMPAIPEVKTTSNISI
jgi:ribosomal protein L37AE/L43A